MADDLRDRLRYPVAAAITLVWIIAGIAAIVLADVQVFVIASGPFTILCGYLFTEGLFRRAVNGNTDG